MTAMFDLSGRNAIVTGGNGGIGLGMAQALAEAGARVLVVGRNAAKNGTALAALGIQHETISADVTQEAGCDAVVAMAEQIFGRLDILVNNAGTNRRHRPEAMDAATWHSVLDANLTSMHLMSRAAFPMLSKQGGKVLNVGSMLSLFGLPFSPAYAASKGGVVQYTRVLATAWAENGIQANAILPGWIDTDLTRGARAEVPGLHDRILARTPAGRWGVPADLGGIAVFLASSASDFVTGAAIPVDGGYSVQG